jgi:putative hydrolase of the HAD superfamily
LTSPRISAGGAVKTDQATRIRAVFLDVGGTLAYPHPSFHGLIARVCQDNGLAVGPEDAERAEPAVWARIAEREDVGRGFSVSADKSKAFWLFVYRAFLTELGYPEAAETDLPERLLDTFIRLENYRLYDDALPALEVLRRSDLILGVLSNWEEWLERLMVSLGIRDYFDVAVISGLAGHEKPDREIFLAALEAAGTHPEETMHVGDSLRDDVEGAQAVGIRAVLLDRRGGATVPIASMAAASVQTDARGLQSTQSGPHARITSLLELPALLGIPHEA